MEFAGAEKVWKVVDGKSVKQTVLAVGGQTLSLLLTLLAIPVLYSFFDDFGQICQRALKKNAIETAPQPETVES